MEIDDKRFITELLKGKEALLEAVLAYNVLAAHVHQEVISIDFEGPGLGQVCQIRIKELTRSSPLIQKYIRTRTMMDSVLGHLGTEERTREVQGLREMEREIQRLQKDNVPFVDADTKEFLDFAKDLGLRVGVEAYDPADPIGFKRTYLCEPNPNPRQDIEESRLKHGLEAAARNYDYKIIDDPLKEELKQFHWPGEFECCFMTCMKYTPSRVGRCGLSLQIGYVSEEDLPRCRGRLDCSGFKNVLEAQRGHE